MSRLVLAVLLLVLPFLYADERDPAPPYPSGCPAIEPFYDFGDDEEFPETWYEVLYTSNVEYNCPIYTVKYVSGNNYTTRLVATYKTNGTAFQKTYPWQYLDTSRGIILYLQKGYFEATPLYLLGYPNALVTLSCLPNKEKGVPEVKIHVYSKTRTCSKKLKEGVREVLNRNNLQKYKLVDVYKNCD